MEHGQVAGFPRSIGQGSKRRAGETAYVEIGERLINAAGLLEVGNVVFTYLDGLFIFEQM